MTQTRDFFYVGEEGITVPVKTGLNLDNYTTPTVEATIRKPDGSTVVDVSGTITDGPNGVFEFTVPTGLFDAAGKYRMHAKVTASAEGLVTFGWVKELTVKELFEL